MLTGYCCAGLILSEINQIISGKNHEAIAAVTTSGLFIVKLTPKVIHHVTLEFLNIKSYLNYA